MTLPLSVADVLAEHVVFELDCIDRMYWRLSQNPAVLSGAAGFWSGFWGCGCVRVC